MGRAEEPVKRENQGPRSLTTLEPYSLQHQQVSEKDASDIPVSMDVKEQI